MYESLLENSNILIFIIVAGLAVAAVLIEGMSDSRISQQENSEQEPSSHD